MSINISTEPIGFYYPAYNDSFVKFTSTLSGQTFTEITALPESHFPKPFKIYPKPNGSYLFNLKELVKSRFNQNGFSDLSVGLPFGWSEPVPYLTEKLSMTFTDYNEDGAGEPVTRLYYFYKSVKQIGESVHSNPQQILNNSKNGVDYNLTYFEGYPFSFEIQEVQLNNSVQIRNTNTSVTSPHIISTSTAPLRIYTDKVTTNWTTANFLPLQDNLNKLEILKDSILVTNLNLKKVPAKCGVYLKWFNSDGGYSYYLFDEFYKSNLKMRNDGYAARNDFNNIKINYDGTPGVKNPLISLGKSGGEDLQIRTVCDKNEVKHLSSLFKSPSVQMWSQKEPFISGEWIDVQISGSHSYSTKKALNEVKLTVELPEEITMKL